MLLTARLARLVCFTHRCLSVIFLVDHLGHGAQLDVGGSLINGSCGKGFSALISNTWFLTRVAFLHWSTLTLTDLTVSVVFLDGIVFGEAHATHPLDALGCGQSRHLRTHTDLRTASQLVSDTQSHKLEKLTLCGLFIAQFRFVL